MSNGDRKHPLSKTALPVSPPDREPQPEDRPGAPDLHIEEIEEKQIPKDRNIFDK